ncbi:hypothetical protein TNCV_3900401 [Trichonephila clavipes]|nr:hypothetical protein TNCV_3900401 [Trichonephila clavipes]
MALRKDLNQDEIANLLRNISENESASLDSDEIMRLNERDCEESDESEDVIDDTPVNPDIYVARDGAECNSKVTNCPLLGRAVLLL